MAVRSVSKLTIKKQEFLINKRCLLVLTVILCSIIQVLCKTDCNGVPCHNGVCNEKVNGTNACECFEGWTGLSCSYCSGRIRLNATDGIITEGVGNYSEDNKCMWLIEPDPPGKPIHIRSHQFATECGWDHLYIFNGDSVFAPLIAAYSGLVQQELDMNNSVTEIVADSGKAYLYFYSDAAYNMTGFHLHYTVGTCINNCSDQGDCLDSGCNCNAGFKGPYCETEICPRNCTNQGTCKSEKCLCNAGYKGDDCSIPINEEFWTRHYSPKPPLGRASAASVVIGNEIWVTGGYSFGRDMEFLVVYNIDSQKWRTIVPASTDNPEYLYSHSVVHYKKCLYIYGGVAVQHIESRLWIYNMTSNMWSHQDYNETAAIAGHTAVLLNSTMLIIFGHSPLYGYMNRVHEIDLETDDRDIIMAETSGALIKGGYGHSSVYAEQAGVIFVYGGYISGSTTQYLLTDKLFSYDPQMKFWRILARSGSPRYLHSAVLYGNQMLVFGGNTHNDTNISFGAKCYSTDFMAYDLDCNSWKFIHSAKLPSQSARYGHIAHTYTEPNSSRSRMLIVGGFDSVMLNDVLEYQTGDCGIYKNKSECLASFPGTACVWNDTDCVDRQTAMNNNDNYVPVCNPSQDAASYCAKETSCGSCLSTAYDCQWCSNNCSQSCSDKDKYHITNVTQCPLKYRVVCDQMNNCRSCATYQDCKWHKASKSCRFREGQHSWTESGSLLNEEPDCGTPCFKHNSCENCTTGGCMWCGSQQRCVETNSYVASFLYGQCQEWTTHSAKCTGTRCSDLHSCDECKSNPSCGWCNDASDTGLGICLQGASSGPVSYNETTSEYKIDEGICPAKQWHFIDCPSCQCNGHSKCTNISDKCDLCMNLTTGDHCEKCDTGFFGNPENGGNCTKCKCFDQADECDSRTGQCYCKTRGVKGDKCNECDVSNNYFGNPNNGGTCYYDLKTDYQFTFNLSKPDDHYYNNINFMNIPPSSDRDVDFTVNCSGLAYLNITWKSKSSPNEQFKAREYRCMDFRAKFEHKDFNFGPDENVTFFVYIYGFETPFWLQISFSQFPKIDLVHFFVTFFSCFIALLFIAAVLYKIKHKYDSYRRAQRMIVEMEEMASRPFASVVVEAEKRVEFPENKDKDNNPDLRKRKRTSNKPSQIALEPLGNQKAAVVSLFVQLPTGSEDWAPAGQSGIAIASALVTFGHQRKQSIEHGKSDKVKHKKHTFAALDTCV